jgi:VWFA-related protein
VNDVSGRVFIFFVDDLHLAFHSSGRVRELFKKISKTLLHDGDMFGIVSTGTSSISVQLTYDKRRLDEAIQKMTGSELRPEEIVNGESSDEGPSEVRWRAHVAFSTAMELLQNLEKLRDRRKALVYVSDGYDLNPFEDARLGLMDPSSPFLQNRLLRDVNAADRQDGVELPGPNSAGALALKQGGVFAEADLARELGEITRQANRSNVTLYTIDPRGLTTANSDIDQPVDPQQWAQYLRNSQDSLRVLAEETGGIAVVNMNDFDGALKRIDADSSDYYILGYYSKNPDVTHRRRKIEVRVNRPGSNISVASRKEYVLQPEMVTGSGPEALPVVPVRPRE